MSNVIPFETKHKRQKQPEKPAIPTHPKMPEGDFRWLMAASKEYQRLKAIYPEDSPYWDLLHNAQYHAMKCVIEIADMEGHL